MWDRLSQKTISRYCPFKDISAKTHQSRKNSLWQSVPHIPVTRTHRDYTVRGQSNVWRPPKYWPPSECVLPPPVRKTPDTALYSIYVSTLCLYPSFVLLDGLDWHIWITIMSWSFRWWLLLTNKIIFNLEVSTVRIRIRTFRVDDVWEHFAKHFLK